MGKSKSSVLLAMGAVLGFSAGYTIRGFQEIEKPATRITQQLEKSIEQAYKVEKVVDGDTIYLENGIYIELKKIRLLGINTPEKTEPLYREAKLKLEELIAKNNNIIYLESDKEDMDKYGRALRYVIVGNKNINIEMIRLGYARAFMHKGLRYEKELLTAEKEAKENKRGLWSK